MNTKQKVIDLIKEDIKNETSGNLLFEEVKKVLKPFIGKPYSKRMETALKKHFGNEYLIYIERIGSLINVKIKGPWENQGEYNLVNGYSMLIGYSTDETYQEGDGKRENGGINYYSISYGAAALERNEKREAFLKSKNLDKLVKAIDLMTEAKELLSDPKLSDYNIQSRYTIERAFNLKDEK